MKIYDVVVVGAGLSGLYAVHGAKRCGWSVHAYEAGAGVGGAWYWNRYPGCRVDIEGFEFSYAFCDELQQDWTWSERYPSQLEVERYLNHVCDRFGLREHISFETQIRELTWNDRERIWCLSTGTGSLAHARAVILATGLYSKAHRPNFEGLNGFKGETLFSSSWPREPVDFSGKQVGLIGTGASGIQLAPVVAQTAAHLSVFQRTAVYTVPLRNGPADPARTRAVKASYAALRRAEADSPLGFTHLHSQIAPAVTQSALALSDDERRSIYEDRWASGGLCFYYTFTDLLSDENANRTLSEFFADKIRGRVKDPKLAALLTPRDQPALTKRLAGDTGYMETMERDNVELVDLRAEPIRRFTERGIIVGSREIPLDMIILATGFDFGTGALERLLIRGRDGRTLREEWAGGTRTYLGMMAPGFPNLFWISGPGCPFYNPMLLAQYQFAQIERLLDRHCAAGYPVEPTDEAAARWTELHNSIASVTLFTRGDNYFIGGNVPGKRREMPLFLGGFQMYAQHCDAAANTLGDFVGIPYRAATDRRVDNSMN